MSDKEKDLAPEDDRQGVALMVDIISDERAWLMAYTASRTAVLSGSETPFPSTDQARIDLACKEADLVVIEFRKRFRPEEDEEAEPEPKKDEKKPEKGPDGLPVIPPPSFLKKKS